MAPNNSLLFYESGNGVPDDKECGDINESMSSLLSNGFNGVSDDTDLTLNNKQKGYPELPWCSQESMGSAGKITQISNKTVDFISPINIENKLYGLEEQGYPNVKL
jgi:hypothetical protein